MLYLLLNFAAFLLWQYLLIVIHEGGHALVAYLLRYRIFSIRLGYGKRLLLSEVGGVWIEVNAIPLIGLTYAVPTRRTAWRLRQWFFVLGGPLTHVIFLTLAYLVYPDSFYLGYVLPKIFHQFAPIESFIVANIALLLSSLIPYTSQKAVGSYGSDGLQLLKVPLARKEAFDEFERVLPRLDAFFAIQRGDFVKPVRLYEDLFKEDPDNNLNKHDLAVARLGMGDVPEARLLFNELLDAEEFSKPEVRPILLNNIAWTSVVGGTAEFLEIADRYSEEALAANPSLSIFLGTRGTVLIYLGRIDEGISLLKSSYRSQSVPESRAASALFLARGYAGKGDAINTQKWLAKARKNAPDYWLIPRIATEISELPK